MRTRRRRLWQRRWGLGSVRGACAPRSWGIVTDGVMASIANVRSRWALLRHELSDDWCLDERGSPLACAAPSRPEWFCCDLAIGSIQNRLPDRRLWRPNLALVIVVARLRRTPPTPPRARRRHAGLGVSCRHLHPIGVYPTTVERWELGQRRPSPDHVSTMESLLGSLGQRAPVVANRSTLRRCSLLMCPRSALRLEPISQMPKWPGETDVY